MRGGVGSYFPSISFSFNMVSYFLKDFVFLSSNLLGRETSVLNSVNYCLF